MSRIGKLPIKIPSGVTITVDNQTVTVAGSKGTLTESLLPGLELKIENDEAVLVRKDDEQRTRAMHGLMRSLINNMVQGVSEGFTKQLEINGVGYRVSLAGANLKFSLGFSHDITFPVPTGVTASVDQNVITVTGISKQAVGQVAADIRKLRKPEPYKGKGIKYVGERIIRKSGKSGKE